MNHRNCIARVIAGLVALGVSMVPGTSRALPLEYVTPAEQPKPENAGWMGTIRLGANINFMHNKDVVGQDNGQAWTMGANIEGAITHYRNGHDWRNTLSILESFTYGPPINQFMKTSDRLLFESLYYYHPTSIPWLGPFGRFVLDTQIFEGADVRANDNLYQVIGEADPLSSTPSRRFKTTESFKPLTLKESVGVFARPVGREEVEIMIRLGIGSHQVFADGQFAVKDDAATVGTIEVMRLHDYVQVGTEAALVIQGAFYGNKVSYKAYLETLIPFYRTKETGDTRTDVSLTNVEAGALLSFKLVDWASVDYSFKALRQPQLVDKWQFQNMLLLTFAYAKEGSLEAPPSPPPPPPPPLEPDAAELEGEPAPAAL
jgi:hypothetical protein